ncbi:hypothetical protein BCR44DRAFT_84477 [Catenaria anguillulae PL171]|uniref:Uncharacterized protein n=1 Tax=Catenaria anguillulae PL171 TaxID=765915 RepID=A0A1Y2HBM6_9FUNG|nr:hypothetical protein BCR44DRAFT_84477 [Catenaria anguillulae PL171]
MFYEYPNIEDECRFRAAYHQKLRKRIKAVLAVNTLTAAMSFSGLILLRIATGALAIHPLRPNTGGFTSWLILDGSDVIVNFALLVAVLLVSSKHFLVSNSKLEAVSIVYVLLMFVAAMATSIIQRRLDVNDRASLHLSNHRLVFSFFSMATLRLRPRVHVSIVCGALFFLSSASWALVPADRMLDMLGIMVPATLAALGSTTLCFMFESASRRYFWLKHCSRTATLAGKRVGTNQQATAPIAEIPQL